MFSFDSLNVAEGLLGARIELPVPLSRASGRVRRGEFVAVVGLTSDGLLFWAGL